MKLKIQRKINKALIDIELDERDDKVALGKAITLSVEDYCDNCKKSDNIVWRQNKAQDDKGGSFIYIKRKCLHCGAESTLGEYQGGQGYFWKKFEVYQGTQKALNDIGAKPMDEEIDLSKVPF